MVHDLSQKAFKSACLPNHPCSVCPRPAGLQETEWECVSEDFIEMTHVITISTVIEQVTQENLFFPESSVVSRCFKCYLLGHRKTSITCCLTIWRSYQWPSAVTKLQGLWIFMMARNMMKFSVWAKSSLSFRYVNIEVNAGMLAPLFLQVPRMDK